MNTTTPRTSSGKAPVVRARAVAPGRLVRVRVGDLPEPLSGLPLEAEILGMKTIRHGKGFIAHYLVPLDASVAAPEDIMLISLDTDTPMKPAAPDLHLDLVAVDVAAPTCGQVLENASGRFLKVRESYKDAFSLGYVEITAGDIRRRQDRGITAVYDWTVRGGAVQEEARPELESTPAVPVILRETKAGVQALRAMTVRDVDAVAELLVSRNFPVGKDAEQRLSELLKSPLAVCQVAEVDDAIAGVVVAHYDGFHVHLSMIAVDARFDRHGIGRALLEATAEAALARGALGILADAALSAVPFLAATGFRLSDNLRLRRDVNPTAP